MDKQLFFRRKLVTAVMAVFAMTGTALAQDPEPNDSIATAHHLEIDSNGTATIYGVVGTKFGFAVLDVDFFSFDAKAGDEVTLNIDGAQGGDRSFDSIIFLFGPGISAHVYNDDYGVSDEGSPGGAGALDSRIDKFPIPMDGRYTVAVTGVGVFLNGDGTYPSSPVGENGDYTLVISGVTAAAPAPAPSPEPLPQDPALEASIEIKSGTLVRGSRHDIVVALLGSKTFKPSDVDVSSLTFELAGTERDVKRCSKHLWRVNHDKNRDLVCHFSTDLSGVPAGNVKAVLRGKTKSGQAFKGQGSVRVMEKRAHRRDRD